MGIEIKLKIKLPITKTDKFEKKSTLSVAIKSIFSFFSNLVKTTLLQFSYVPLFDVKACLPV